MSAPDYTTLFYWVREREEIRLRKAGGHPSELWTSDSILSTYRFCNVRREDDRVTGWVRDYIRDPYADHPHLWLMLCIARQINWPDDALATDQRWRMAGRENFQPSEITMVLNKRKLMARRSIPAPT
jgi:hypothetical protein